GSEGCTWPPLRCHRRRAPMPDAARPLAEPVGLGPTSAKPSVRRRVLSWLRTLWKLVSALAGRSPKRPIWIMEDIQFARLAYRIRALARWAAAWVLPPAGCYGLYAAGGRLLAVTTDVDGLLRAVLPAASVTSGLLAAGLMSAT